MAAMRTAAAIAAAVAGAVLGPVLALPTSADAAVGRFLYTSDRTGLPVELRDPEDGGCYLTTADGYTWNQTDADAVLFATPDCLGEPVGMLRPGEEAVVEFRTVLFTVPFPFPMPTPVEPPVEP